MIFNYLGFGLCVSHRKYTCYHYLAMKLEGSVVDALHNHEERLEADLFPVSSPFSWDFDDYS